MASITPRGKNWRVRWRNPGERIVRSRECPTEAIAKRVQKEILAARALNRPWPAPAPPRDPEPVYMTTAIKAWLADLARTQRAPRTIARAHAVLVVFVPWLKARTGVDPRVSSLTRSVLEAWDAEQVARGNGQSTRRVAMWAVASVWRWAWDHEEWRRGMTAPAIPAMPRPTKRPVVAPTIAQLDAVVREAHEGVAVRRDREWVRRLVLLMRGLGWRVTQCLGLEHADMDLDTIRLRPELGKSAWERAGRTVTMAPWLVAEIRTWLPRSGRLVGSIRDHDAAAIALRRLWQAADVPEAIWRGRPDHAFRSGLISELARLRVDREAVEHYVGHAPSGMRGPYVDPSALPLGEVAAAIPAPGVQGGPTALRARGGAA